MRYKPISACWLMIMLLFFSGCRREKVPEPYKPKNAHDAYCHSLQQAELIDTALGRDWIAAADKAVDDPIEIPIPFREIFYVDPAEASAVAYRFEVKRGQRIEVEVDFQGSRLARLFIDLFRVEPINSRGWVHVASADKDENRLEFEPRRDARYVLRLQTELLRGGRYTVTIRNAAALNFPLAEQYRGSIGSGFGAPRDGGRRSHHGVDIFAPRHTPVMAPSRAYVQVVKEGGIGGRYIWLADYTRSLYLYFAHLESQDVQPLNWVDAGQVIGTVGNSGNARTTPPHLHFGIYSRGEGPLDPHYFITRMESEPPEVTADVQILGQWMRSKPEALTLRVSPESRAESLTSLARHVPVKVLAAAGERYRVLLPDGVSGYIPAVGVESIREILQQRNVTTDQTIRQNPLKDAAEIGLVDAGEGVEILGEYEGHWFVRTQEGGMGWLPIPPASLASSSPAANFE